MKNENCLKDQSKVTLKDQLLKTGNKEEYI